jgi:hypothetical protein
MRRTADVARVAWFLTEAAPADRASRDDAPEPMPDWKFFGQPEPDSEFDEHITW